MSTRSCSLLEKPFRILETTMVEEECGQAYQTMVAEESIDLNVLE
jgi:hypothetical protein